MITICLLKYMWCSSWNMNHEMLVYSGPHKLDNVLRCIFNQMEIPNGQKKVQQGIEGSNRA